MGSASTHGRANGPLTIWPWVRPWRLSCRPGASQGTGRYLEKGESLLDYLLLYQQCWTNPLLEGLTGPAMLLGGFTTQNSDAEWSDARQSQCGNILLDYYRATGKTEYLERGVAALRAQFPISPSENWAHSGYGGKAGVSSFHWGYRQRHGGNRDRGGIPARWHCRCGGRGRGGCERSQYHRNARSAPARSRWRSTPRFPWPREPIIVFRNIASSGQLCADSQWRCPGDLRGGELEKGIATALPKEHHQ